MTSPDLSLLTADISHSKSESGSLRRRAHAEGLRRGTISRQTTSKLRPAERKNTLKSRKTQATTPGRTWVLPLGLLVATLLLYASNPTESNIAYHFIFLSYKVEDAGLAASEPVQYGKGLWDVAFVAFYTVFLIFTREFMMHELLKPLAGAVGIKSRGKQTRFSEQIYTALYIAFVGPLGMYVMSRTPVWYFNTHGMYENFPHKTHEAVFKFYYLFQAAFWAQQSVVMLLGMEARRKDFYELVAHHVVTVGLIALSYQFHFTYVGIAVYITHDISDFFLATSKALNYVDSPIQGPYFATCIGVWIYLRHYINLRILFSHFGEVQTVGPYALDADKGYYKICNMVALGLLALLQCLNLFWLYYLLRVAYRFVFLSIAKDDRSEDEESDAEEQEVKDTGLDGKDGL